MIDVLSTTKDMAIQQDLLTSYLLLPIPIYATAKRKLPNPRVPLGSRDTAVGVASGRSMIADEFALSADFRSNGAMSDIVRGFVYTECCACVHS